MRRALLSPLGVLGLIVLLLAAGFAVYQLYPRQGVERVKQLVDWDSSCDVVVYDSDRYFYADRWRGIENAGVVRCEHLGPSVFYARFRTHGALKHVLRASPPLSLSCVYGDDELAIGLMDTRGEFESLCSDLDGRLRERPPDAKARLARALREQRTREDDSDSQEDSHH